MGAYLLQQFVNGLSAGSLYALMAVGLAMVFGILRLINFAHGDLMMIAAYLAVFSIGAGLSLVASLPDGWITRLITQFAGDARFRHVAVNREESAVALSAGTEYYGFKLTWSAP